MKFSTSAILTLGLAPSFASAELTTTSRAGRELMAHARRLNDGGEYDFVSQYAIKFQGCHHVQQWNSNSDRNGNNNNNNNNNNNKNNNNNNNNNNNGEDQVRIMTKRLVRFRLCPVDSCSSDRTSGCSAKFGDYIVDMNTFVSYYMGSLEENKEMVCEQAEAVCAEYCADNGDGNCEKQCYEAEDASFCLENDLAEQYGFDVDTYLQCAKTKLNDNAEYYIGPFCAAQGGEIHLGLFTDDTCTTRADNGDTLFANTMGYSLPFSEDSLIPNRCLQCGITDNNGDLGTSDNCAAIYKYSGKCETRMNIDYPNESSCDYIEGIKIIREDGVIRTSSVRKSKAAAVAIGFFICLSVLLAGYVFYLRTKLSRAQINLAASTNPLT